KRVKSVNKLTSHAFYKFKKTGVAGFEPTHEGVKVPCLTAWLYPKKKGRIVGIEPTHTGATIRCVNHFAISAITICCFFTTTIILTLYLFFSTLLGLHFLSKNKKEHATPKKDQKS